MQNKLCGVWKLVSFEIKNHLGQNREWGQEAHGTLIYTADNYVSVSINSKIDSKDESLEALFNSVLFYAGTYTVKDQNTVVHYVSQATDPQRIGKEMIREFKIENDELRIISKGDFGVATICWKRKL
jgi:hypothetical protein